MELSFGDFRLNPVDGLRRGARELHVTPKSLSVLYVLANRGGAVVSKDELIRAVWPDVAISDSALTSCIKELRRALGDDARQPRFIETLNRRGFRFLAPVVAAAARHAPPVPESILVGRDEPFARIAAALERAIDGDRQVVLVGGEPGIGKTALVDAVLQRLRPDAGWRITHGHCVEHYGESEPFQPLFDAVARLCREPGDECSLAALRRCAPSWLAQLPSLQSPDEHRVLERRTAGTTSQRMRRELVDALEAMAEAAPIVLWIEDLHWSDVATIDWIADFAARRDRARLVIITTCRTAEVRAGDHPLYAMAETLHARQWCDEVALARLTEADVRELIAARFAMHRDEQHRVGRLVHQHTGGNPLFVKHVLADLVSRGVLAEQHGAWTLAAVDAATLGVPDDVRRTIMRQLERLDARGRAYLEVMSVLGGPCAAATVAAGAAAAAVDVEATLGALAREEWLIGDRGRAEWPDGTQSAAFDFLHALHRDVVATGLGPARRLELHRRIGERIEAAYASRIDEVAAELAVHFDAAGDVPRAIHYLQRAADTSRRRSAYTVSEGQLRRALTLVETLPPSHDRTRREVDVRLALGSLLMAIRGFGSDEIAAHYTRALALSREIASADQLFPSLWGLWLFRWAQGGVRDASQLVCEIDRHVREQPDPVHLLQAYHAGWATSFSLGDLEETRRQAAEGFALYRIEEHASLASAYGNHDAGACALNFLARALVLLGTVDEAVRRSDAAIALARELQHPFTLAQTLAFAATVHQVRCDPEATRARASAAALIAREHGFRLIAAWSSILEGWSLVRIGQHATGVALLNEALPAARAGSLNLMTHFLGVAADACLVAGRIDEGRAVADEGLRLAVRGGERFYEAELYRLRGELRRSAGGDAAGADEDFRRAFEVAHEHNARWLMLRAATSLAAGDPRRHSDRVRLLADAADSITEGAGLPDVVSAARILRRPEPPPGARPSTLRERRDGS
jgi:DNA-binding winged helix-turn-helix (wHTH) protein/tetratricopeptide (TPR) repeat protein